MKFFLPKPLSYVSTNVAENEAEDGTFYIDRNPLLGYNKGDLRKEGQILYRALTLIYPLAHYIWEDAISTDIYALNLSTRVKQYPVASKIMVPITIGVTVVYVRSSGKWYIAKTTGTIDFLLENPTTPTNFNQIVTTPVPYRFDYADPYSTENTLYWGYEGMVNKYRALDRAISTQTTKYLGNLEMSFNVNACNALSLFNVIADSVTVTVFDLLNGIATPVQIFTSTISMVDTSALDTYEKVCTIPFNLKPEATFFFQARYSQRIDLTFNSSVGSPSVGVIKVGTVDFLGTTQDGVSLGIKSYNTVAQRVNGELVWDKDNTEGNKVFTLRYNIKIETPIFDTMVTKLRDITDKEVVLLGDDGDPVGYRTLRNYGAIKGSSAELTSNSTKSSLSIEIENFS